MTDPVQEAIAELVFADQLVDVHELEAIEADAWFRAYLSQRQLDPASFMTRLMTAHDDPAVDEQALDRLPSVDREALLCLLTDLTAIDDHHDPRELAILSRFATTLRLQQPPLDQRLSEARLRIEPLSQQLNSPLPLPRKRVRALRRADRLFGQPRIDGWAELLRQKLRLRRWRRETFFNHKAYAHSLQEMQRLTLELMPLTQEVLQQATSSLTDLQQGFQHITTGLVAGELPKESQEQLATLLASVRERLDRLVQDDLDGLRNDLLAKQRSLNRFCMAAVGRTKAGKSTLIATLTGRDQAAKGDGGQGFTRYNRAYTYCGIRLIDTPGIGAAGGQGESSQQAEERDSQVARSIFPETDLVCFVMDSDSTTPCARELIQQLHHRGKAFIILLNVKAATQGGLDLCRQRLDAKFAREGEQSISGNIAAIRRDLSGVLGVQPAEAVPIIPIHAISAFKATYSVQDPEEKEAWRDLSRVDVFLEQLDQLITDQAPMLRRRTLRDNPRRELVRIATDLEGLAQSLQEQAKVFGNTEESALKQVAEIFGDLERSLMGRLDELFKKLEAEATTFSNDNFRRNGSEIERRWRKALERFDLNKKLEGEMECLKTELASRLEDLQADILARLQFQAGTVSFKHGVDFGFDIEFEENLRRNIKLGFQLLSSALSIAMLWLGPAGWVVSAALVIANLLPSLFESFLPDAEERRQKAKASLKRKLLEGFSEPRSQISTQVNSILKQLRDQVTAALQQSLGGSQLALLAFHDQLQKTQTDLQQQAQRLS
ncbi:50S ribosome-binding GTPase [Vulcanococcus limneticus Candia 3F8]|uniref:GTPase n=1 Tax=Vulcanococcus limneticus TaxID=2170428 RepID=UPI000B99535E|nr:GTPase [Vulcanococcus limneticus]MCP9793324.1 50S ribosome-binding GTPase [Vulcanococcus limneticus MW73D5]MCP9895333.1 50S ribosome-binding GTPase [Vulcanococcus limneticus Candia 3F8]MCP9898721.1 50S ribosome-binding GTPase [Vulcanococcus limneticus Candia 3B3]